MFGRHWEPARGRVIDKVPVGNPNGSGILVHEFIVDVERPNGERLRARVEEPRIATDFWDPRIGQDVRVEVEARSGKVRFDKSDPGISYKAQRQAKREAFDARLGQAPEPVGPRTPAAPFAFPAGVPSPVAGAPVVQARMVTPEELQALLAGIANMSGNTPH